MLPFLFSNKLKWFGKMRWQFDYLRRKYLSASRTLSARHFGYWPDGLPSPQMYCISSAKLREFLMTKLFKSLKIRVSLAENSCKFGDTNVLHWLPCETEVPCSFFSVRDERNLCSQPHDFLSCMRELRQHLSRETPLPVFEVNVTSSYYIW